MLQAGSLAKANALKMEYAFYAQGQPEGQCSEEIKEQKKHENEISWNENNEKNEVVLRWWLIIVRQIMLCLGGHYKNFAF